MSHRALQLELARQEYKLLTDEAKNLLGRLKIICKDNQALSILQVVRQM